MAQHLRTFLKLIFILGFCGIFLWAAFRKVDAQELWTAAHNARPYWLVTVALVLILSNIPRAWRWRILIAPVSREVSTWRLFVALLIGYAGNNVFPRAGEVARVVAVRRDRDLPMGALLATVLVERVLDMLTMLVLFGAVLFVSRSEIARVFPQMEGVGLAVAVVTVLLLVLFGVLSACGERALTAVERILARISPSLAGRAVDILRAFFQGMGGIRTTAGYVEIVAFTVLLNLCYFLAVYLPFLSFGFAERYGLGPAEALVVMVISTVGVILPSLGGIGTYHYFCSQTLHHIYNVPLGEALAFATVVHGIAYFTFLIAGGPGLLSLFWGRNRSGRSAPAVDR